MAANEAQQVHIRVGANALIVRDGAVLLVEFDDETGLHYTLPRGGIEPGEAPGNTMLFSSTPRRLVNGSWNIRDMKWLHRSFGHRCRWQGSWARCYVDEN